MTVSEMSIELNERTKGEFVGVDSLMGDLKKEITMIAQTRCPDFQDVQLVLVTKTVSVEKILEAYDAGHRDFGENRVQEWQLKKDLLPQDIRWHLIGHLQTNKAKYVVGKIHLIHSLDRLELVEALEKHAKAQGVSEVFCLIQVNLSGEESKFGLDPARVDAFMHQVAGRSLIRIKGVMSIGPFTEDPERIRNCFRQSKELLENLKREFPQCSWEILSMGMSGDYRLAIEEGSTMLRIGTLVFGERKR